MMIEVNGREFSEQGLRARAEARRRAGLYDDRLVELLRRDIVEEIEEHAFSMIQVVYDLQRVLEDAGLRLEPPADLSSGDPAERKGRLASLARRLQTRFIRAVNEGYVQQQEKFNTFFTKAVDLAYRQLCGAEGGIRLGEVAERRDLWLARRPRWDEDTAGAVAGEGNGAALVVGIPGTAVLDHLQEGKRLLLAVDTCDAAVAEAQSRFLPAWFHPQPMRLIEHLAAEDLGLAVLAFPECLTAGELGELCAWAAARMGPGGVALIALNRGWSAYLGGEDGFVRYWPRRFLQGLLSRHGMRVVEWRGGERVFLRGEMGA